MIRAARPSRPRAAAVARASVLAAALLCASVLTLPVGERSAPAAENFACGPGGVANSKTEKCDCPPGKIEKTSGGTSRCVDKPPPPPPPKASAAASSSASGSSTTTSTALPPCPGGMVRIPGGKYVTGQNQVSVMIGSFCMDVTEVTVAAYAACVASKSCTPLSTTVEWVGLNDEQRTKGSTYCNGTRGDRLDHPANCVDFNQAYAYCQAQAKRLPNEEEWEFAARSGDKAFKYPWGDDAPDARACWSLTAKRASTCAVGSLPAGDDAFGVHDLAGNVWEWTSTRATVGADDRIYRGGGIGDNNADHLTAWYRGGDAVTTRSGAIGFRCVQ